MRNARIKNFGFSNCFFSGERQQYDLSIFPLLFFFAFGTEYPERGMLRILAASPDLASAER